MKTEGVRKLWDRYKYAALILAVGAGLLLWPGGTGPTAQTGQSEAPPAYEAADLDSLTEVCVIKSFEIVS